jgi:hypothetical protein
MCNSEVFRHRITDRMSEIAKRPRSASSIRGTPEAKKRARKAALARWRKVKEAPE